MAPNEVRPWISPSVPVLHTEESIQSYVTRALRTSGVARAKTFYAQLLGINSDRPSVDKIEYASSHFQVEMKRSGHSFRRSAFEGHSHSAVGLPFQPPEPIRKRLSIRSMRPRRDGTAGSGMPHTIVGHYPSFCIECARAKDI